MDDFTQNPAPARKSGPLKKLGIILGVLVVLIIGATLALPSMIDQQKYKTMLQEKAAAAGYKVDWDGNIGVSLVPSFGIDLNNLSTESTAGDDQSVKLKEAKIRIAFIPLFSGQVKIKSITLDEPQIGMTYYKKGSPNKKPSKPADDKPSSNSKGEGKPLDLSLDMLEIKNGSLTLKNGDTGEVQKISDLDAVIRTESVTGPFAAKGNVTYNDKKIEFDAKAGKLDGNQKNYPVSVKIGLPDTKVEAEYAGVIATSDPVLVDGEITIKADDLVATLQAFTGKKPDLPDGIGGTSEINGKIVYDGSKAALSNMRLAVGDLAYTGNVGVSDLKAETPTLSVNLTPQKNSKAQDASPLVAALKDLSIKGDGTYVKGKVSIEDGVIAFRDQKVRVDGSFVPAEGEGRPVIDIAVKADKINVDELQGMAAPAKKPAGKEAAKAGAPSEIEPVAADADDLQGKSLPFDGRLKVDVASLIMGGQTYQPLKMDVVSKGNTLNINSLSVGAMDGATINASGKIANLTALSGLDLKGSVKVADADALMQTFKIAKPEAIKQKIGQASVDGSIKGSLDALAFDGTLNALRFAVTGKGTVKEPLNEPAINQLDLRIVHPNLVDAIRTFQPGFDSTSSFDGPLSLSAAIDLAQGKYQIGNIKGNLGSTSVSGNLTLATGGSKPSAAGALTFGDIRLDATKAGGGSAASAGGSGGSTAPAKSGGSDGRWSAAPIDTAWMNSFDADLTIKASSITQSYWKLNNANLSFALSGGVLNVRDLSAGMFGGSVLMNGEAKSGSPLSFNLSLKAKDVDARQLQSALTSKNSDMLTGKIDSFTLDMQSAGSSVSGLVNGLSGKGAMGGKNLVINGIDLAGLAETAKGSFKPLERAGTLFGSFQNGQTQFDTFEAAFPIDKGIVNFTKLVFDGPRAKIDGTGNVNLPRWTVDLRNSVTVKGTDIPPFDVTIRGPLDNPVKTGGSIIEDYLRAKAQKKIEKLLVNELEKRFGAPKQEPVPTSATGADGATAADPAVDGAAPAPAPEKKVSKEEEAIKALQGLFGR